MAFAKLADKADIRPAVIGHQGNGCGCVAGNADPAMRRLDNPTQATAPPLSKCRKDKALSDRSSLGSRSPHPAALSARSFSPPADWLRFILLGCGRNEVFGKYRDFMLGIHHRC